MAIVFKLSLSFGIVLFQNRIMEPRDYAHIWHEHTLFFLFFFVWNENDVTALKFISISLFFYFGILRLHDHQGFHIFNFSLDFMRIYKSHIYQKMKILHVNQSSDFKKCIAFAH